jgi:hypothetical protein
MGRGSVPHVWRLPAEAVPGDIANKGLTGPLNARFMTIRRQKDFLHCQTGKAPHVPHGVLQQFDTILALGTMHRALTCHHTNAS